LIIVGQALGTNSLDYRIYSSDAYEFIVLPSGMLSYAKKSRDFKSFVLDESQTRDSILDVVESDGILWLLTPRGIYQFDMGTQTAEKIPFIRERTCDGKIAADFDYVWLACPDTLMQFDKLGREWLFYPVKKRTKEENFLAGAYSNGDEVYLTFPTEMKVFYVMDEKWKSFPSVKGGYSRNAEYIFNQDNILVIDKNQIYRFIINARSWELITAEENIKDAELDKENLYYLTGTAAYQFTLASSISERFDIKGLKDARAITKLSDSLFALATGEHIILYESEGKSTEYLAYREGVDGTGVEKIVSLGNVMLVFTADRIDLYDFNNKLWETTPMRKMKGMQKALSWDSKGLSAYYSRGYSSTLKGSAEQVMTLRNIGYEETLIGTNEGGVYVYDSTLLVGYKFLTPDIDLTLHNAFPKGRYLDFHFNNTSLSEPARKSVKFRGGHSDIFQDGLLGSNRFDIAHSATLPSSKFEGGSVVFESKRKVKTRDRKVLRVSTGGGYSTTRTIKKVILYQSDGVYNLLGVSSSSDTTTDTTKIVPGSIITEMDGERVDST
jgi:hypothetical protein